ncbi:MAG: 1,5-anhydro-D-fructose reductase [Actinomycetota bacterium]
MRWGVLGARSRIYAKSLAPAFAAAGHRVSAEASREGDSWQSYEELLRSAEVDAVYIPLPNDLHADWIHRCLDAGKHVLCEKPLTLSPEHTCDVFDHAEAAGLVVLEAYMWPHHPRAQRILAMARGGELGALQSGSARFTWPMDLGSGDHRLDHRGAGALFDVGIYCLAPFLLMAGREPLGCGATAVRNHLSVDVTMSGWVDWGAGFASTFHVSFDAPSSRMLVVSGSEGHLEVPEMFVPGPAEASELRIVRRSGEHRELCSGGLAYASMVQHFAAVVAGTEEAVFGRVESERLARLLQALHRSSVR